MKTGVVVLLVSCAGCGAGPEASSSFTDYRRADERLRVMEEFEMRKEACTRAGGSMRVVTGTNARQPPRPRDLRRARCERIGGFGRTD